jgi:hypothetical protein
VRYIAADTDRGTTQVRNLEEIMGALNVKLLEVEVAEIRNVVDAAEVCTWGKVSGWIHNGEV